MAHKRNASKRQKHVPQRTCIACRQPNGKRELIRLVRTPEGVEVDLTGKKAGRGAYLHPDPSCWQVVLQSRHIEQALRTALSADDHRRLTEYMQILSETNKADTSGATSEKTSEKTSET